MYKVSATNGGGQRLATLPSSLRPGSPREFAATAQCVDAEHYVLGILYVMNDGAITFWGEPCASDLVIPLDQITYRLD